jgi:hypothetical protein
LKPPPDQRIIKLAQLRGSVSDEDSMGVDSGLLWIQTEVANPFTLEATNVR